MIILKKNVKQILKNRLGFLLDSIESGLLREAVGISKIKIFAFRFLKIFLPWGFVERIFSSQFQFSNIKLILPSWWELGNYEDIFLRGNYGKAHGFSIGHGWTILDVGANIGIYSIYMSLKNPSARIYAFEPISQTVKYLQNNLKINNISNVKVIDKAVWSHVGEVYFEPNKTSTLYRISRNKIGIPVQAITLDNFINDYQINKIDLLKIDAEFAEDEILSGAESHAIGITEKIVLEYHSDEKKNRVETFLKNKGFKHILQDGSILYFARG